MFRSTINYCWNCHQLGCSTTCSMKKKQRKNFNSEKQRSSTFFQLRVRGHPVGILKDFQSIQENHNTVMVLIYVKGKEIGSGFWISFSWGKKIFWLVTSIEYYMFCRATVFGNSHLLAILTWHPTNKPAMAAKIQHFTKTKPSPKPNKQSLTDSSSVFLWVMQA